jgi:cytidylate kinase
MSYSVVCFSHVTAAGGETIGKRVAEALGFRYVDDEVVTAAAARANLDPAALASVEHHKGFLTRLMDALVAPPKEIEGGYFRLPAEREYYSADVKPSVPSFEEGRRLIQEALVEIAEQARVVIVAHAASMALARRADVLRVHVTASVATRIRRVWTTNKLISEDEHAKYIAETDHQRQKYLQKFYGITDELPTHYDLVINTDALPPERAVAAVLAVVGAPS